MDVPQSGGELSRSAYIGAVCGPIVPTGGAVRGERAQVCGNWRPWIEKADWVDFVGSTDWVDFSPPGFGVGGLKN